MAGESDLDRALSPSGDSVEADRVDGARAPAAKSGPEMTSERKAALERALARLEKGLPLGMTRPLTRDEMHER